MSVNTDGLIGVEKDTLRLIAMLLVDLNWRERGQFLGELLDLMLRFQEKAA